MRIIYKILCKILCVFMLLSALELAVMGVIGFYLIFRENRPDMMTGFVCCMAFSVLYGMIGIGINYLSKN